MNEVCTCVAPPNSCDVFGLLLLMVEPHLVSATNKRKNGSGSGGVAASPSHAIHKRARPDSTLASSASSAPSGECSATPLAGVVNPPPRGGAPGPSPPLGHASVHLGVGEPTAGSCADGGGRATRGLNEVVSTAASPVTLAITAFLADDSLLRLAQTGLFWRDVVLPRHHRSPGPSVVWAARHVRVRDSKSLVFLKKVARPGDVRWLSIESDKFYPEQFDMHFPFLLRLEVNSGYLSDLEPLLGSLEQVEHLRVNFCLRHFSMVAQVVAPLLHRFSRLRSLHLSFVEENQDYLYMSWEQWPAAQDVPAHIAAAFGGARVSGGLGESRVTPIGSASYPVLTSFRFEVQVVGGIFDPELGKAPWQDALRPLFPNAAIAVLFGPWPALS